MLNRGMWCVVLMVCAGVWAQAPDWENEAVIGINKEPSRATGVSFSTVDEAIKAYRMCAQSSAELSLRLQSNYKTGRCLQKQSDVEGAIEQFYQKVMILFLDADAAQGQDREASRMWFWRAAREAAALLEQEGEWRKAVSVMERVLDVGVPADAVIRERIREIKTTRWWEFY